MDVPRLKTFGPGPGPDFDPRIASPRTAARVEDGAIFHFEQHMERLLNAASAMGEPAPWLNNEAEAIAAWVADHSEGSGPEVLRMRLQGQQVWALLEPLPDTPDPYGLIPLPHPLGTPGKHPLACHKGLTGAWGIETLRRARAEGAVDGLLYWPDGTLAETALSSIALEISGELWLPPPEGRVASLAERFDLLRWSRGRPLRYRPFQVRDLSGGTLWCFNAVRGFWRGSLLDARM